MFKGFRGLLSYDIAVDLGTANSLIFVRGRGIVLNEPSVIAVRRDQSTDNPNSIAAVGHQARRMLGRAPGSIIVTRPLRDGVVANYTLTQAMLKYFFHQVRETRFIHRSPRVLIGVPSGSTPVERRAIRESATGAGVRTVLLIEEPLAAALGAGIKIEAPLGSMVLDIGGGTSEVAVISLDGIVYSESLRSGGDRFNDVIIDHVRRQYGAIIGETTAERIKIEVGSAYPQVDSSEIKIRGGHLAEGLPRQFTIRNHEILEALQESLQGIVHLVHRAMENTPAELSSDIAESGLVVTGGGALLRGLDQLLIAELGVPVTIAEDPLTCVARGAGMALEFLDRDDRDLFIID
ncbi:MAG: rod shape-determining protein MreB [Gammaproteobacteria bacterium]|jgi:rod shape-determining protein MreB